MQPVVCCFIPVDRRSYPQIRSYKEILLSVTHCHTLTPIGHSGVCFYARLRYVIFGPMTYLRNVAWLDNRKRQAFNGWLIQSMSHQLPDASALSCHLLPSMRSHWPALIAVSQEYTVYDATRHRVQRAIQLVAVQEQGGGYRGNRGQHWDTNSKVSYCAGCYGETLNVFPYNEAFSDFAKGFIIFTCCVR